MAIGRPPKPKGERSQLVSLRLPAGLLAALRATGRGWQTRAVSALRGAFQPESTDLTSDFWASAVPCMGLAVEVEKGPGYDWLARYRFDDGFEDVIAIFGVLTVEEALQEARYSLESIKEPDGTWRAVMPYDILSVHRADAQAPTSEV